MAEDEAKGIINAELEKAKRRLKAAEVLLGKSMLEDAVNRIYYSAFYAAKAMLNVMGFDAKTHSGLISEFGLRIVKIKLIPAKYGRFLRKAFEMRESGDYQVGVVFEKEEVAELLKEAKDFLAAAEKFVRMRL